MTEALRTIVRDALAKVGVKLSDEAINAVVVINPNVFLWLTDRSEYGGSGGIGYFDQVHAYFYGQTQMIEYQWRDRYSASKDRPWLKVNSLENPTISIGRKVATVNVTLVNNQGKRSEQFIFEKKKKVPAIVELAADEQIVFKAKVRESVKSVMSRLEELWQLKPTMLSMHGYVPYRRPSVKQIVILESIGVAAFVTEEQIDHRGDDPQVRYELYVMTHKDSSPRLIAEDHGYEKREGSKVVAIVELNQDSVLVNTADGKKTFAL